MLAALLSDEALLYDTAHRIARSGTGSAGTYGYGKCRTGSLTALAGEGKDRTRSRSNVHDSVSSAYSSVTNDGRSRTA